jgi:Holliday junction resolvasome RuvABC endonuclease subunit
MKLKEMLENKKSYTSIMGVDMSSKTIAYSVFKKDGDWRLHQRGKIEISGESTFEKCGDIIEKFSGLLKVLEPELIIFESSSYVNNNAVMKQLSMVFGAAAGAASRYGIEVIDIPPVTWQSFIGNPPNSKKYKDEFLKDNPEITQSKAKVLLREQRKNRTIDFVLDNIGVVAEDDDIADAICVGYYAVKNVGVE